MGRRPQQGVIAMYLLTIVFGRSATAWALLFKTEEGAKPLFNAYVEYRMNAGYAGAFMGSDDFGQAFAINFDEIIGIMLEDLGQTETAQVLRRVATERVNAKALGAMKADPTIRQAINAQQSQTPIFTPR